MTKIVNSVLDLIGSTPIVKLNSLVPANSADVYVKLEFFNPGGSVKDRIALSMIEAAEKNGALKEGDTIIEPTSGNTGIGLAMVAAAKGYKIILVMPDTMSVERQKLMKAYGASLILTPGSQGMKGAIAKAEELVAEPGYFMPMQFDNPANVTIHEETTAQEILTAFGDLPIDAFISGVGTGGTVTGVSHIIKEAQPGVKVIAVEPTESQVLQGKTHHPHKIQGIGAGFVPKVLDVKSYDEVRGVSSEEAVLVGRKIASEEGILVGISAGAAIKVALDVAKELGVGKSVLAIVPDNGERYLSTALYEEEIVPSI